MEGIFRMSTKEIERIEMLVQLQEKKLTQIQVANNLGLSVRQIRRLSGAYKTFGIEGVISKKRGKASNHQLPKGLKEWVLATIKEKYSDFGPTLACEKLIEIHKIKISTGTVRSLMIQDGLWNNKRIKKKRIFQLRERRDKEGELVQTDGSPHDWFEGRGSKCSLLHCIDDATGKIQAALFAPSETMWSYFELIKSYIQAHGRPLAFYSDKHAVFKVNRSEALSGTGLTQFGRAMKELDINLIYANSPQAKGRIERSNRTLQDRLTKELRLNKISSIEEANAFLPKFIEDYNRRFAVIPKAATNAHRPLLQEQNLDLIFTSQEFRHLSKNLTFQYKNTIYQIQTEREVYALRKAKITLQEKQDGSIAIFYKGKRLNFTTYKSQAKQGEIIDAKNINTVIDELQKKLQVPKQNYKPAYKHPWRTGHFLRRPLF